MIAGFDLSSSLGLAPEGLTYSIDASGTLVATDAFGDTVFTLSIDESGQYNFTLLKYAGNMKWCYEEDIYNPKHFEDMLKEWTRSGSLQT